MRYQKTIQQRTISEPVYVAGRSVNGKHAASVRIHPAEHNSGYTFARNDIPVHMREIPAHWDSVIPTDSLASLTNKYGVTVSGVECILAALRGCDIDNACIVVDGPFIPSPNGSALHFVEALQKTGSIIQSEPRYIYWAHNPIELRRHEKYAVLSPDKESRITVHIENYADNVGTQVFSFKPGYEEFARDIAPARRMANHQPKTMHDNWNHSSTLPDADISTSSVEGNPASDSAEFDNEFIRHLTLEIYGFLALMRHDFIGHLYLKNPSLTFLHEFVQQFFHSRKHWSYVSAKDYQTIAHSEIRYAQAKQFGRDA